MSDRLEDMRKVAAEWLQKKKERDDAHNEESRARIRGEHARAALQGLEAKLAGFVGANIRSRLVTVNNETVVVHYAGTDTRATVTHYNEYGEVR